MYPSSCEPHTTDNQAAAIEQTTAVLLRRQHYTVYHVGRATASKCVTASNIVINQLYITIY